MEGGRTSSACTFGLINSVFNFLDEIYWGLKRQRDARLNAYFFPNNELINVPRSGCDGWLKMILECDYRSPQETRSQ